MTTSYENSVGVQRNNRNMFAWWYSYGALSSDRASSCPALRLPSASPSGFAYTGLSTYKSFGFLRFRCVCPDANAKRLAAFTRRRWGKPRPCNKKPAGLNPRQVYSQFTIVLLFYNYKLPETPKPVICVSQRSAGGHMQRDVFCWAIKKVYR